MLISFREHNGQAKASRDGCASLTDDAVFTRGREKLVGQDDPYLLSVEDLLDEGERVQYSPKDRAKSRARHSNCSTRPSFQMVRAWTIRTDEHRGRHRGCTRPTAAAWPPLRQCEVVSPVARRADRQVDSTRARSSPPCWTQAPLLIAIAHFLFRVSDFSHLLFTHFYSVTSTKFTNPCCPPRGTVQS
eukprot:6200356-Pleurochrysis_carterae.AAC.1